MKPQEIQTSSSSLQEFPFYANHRITKALQPQILCTFSSFFPRSGGKLSLNWIESSLIYTSKRYIFITTKLHFFEITCGLISGKGTCSLVAKSMFWAQWLLVWAGLRTLMGGARDIGGRGQWTLMGGVT